MLPFTKRPGRDESGDNDVVTKDDLVKPPSAPPASKVSAAPGPRGKFVSVNEEEMTTLMPTKALGDARSGVAPSVRPAAGAPPPSRAMPSSRPGTTPPASRTSSASRSGKFAAQDEDEDGRTVVRGAPKIVKRTNGPGPSSAKMGMPTSPTTISPAAVIKATLESARAAGHGKPRTGDHLMAGPPSDLLEDIADRHPADGGAEHTFILQSPSSSNAPPPMVQGVKALPASPWDRSMTGPPPPNAFDRSMTGPPPPMSLQANQSGGYAAQSGGYAAQSGGYAAQSGGYAAQSGGYSAQGNGPQSQSGFVGAANSSMPAHFMVAQAPYSDGRMDPPGTAVTARTKVGGRPAVSWAIALAAFGLFVGVGAVAVMHGNDGGLTETSASFVDPSRAAGGGKSAAGAAVAPNALAAPVTPVPVATDAPTTVGVPPVAVPAAAAPPADTAAAAVAAPAAPAAAPPAAVAAAPAAPAATAPLAAKPARSFVGARAAPKAAAEEPAAPPVKPARPAKPPPAEEPVAAKPGKPAKPAAKGSGDSAVDEEQRKALKALQESQLETPF